MFHCNICSKRFGTDKNLVSYTWDVRINVRKLSSKLSDISESDFNQNWNNSTNFIKNIKLKFDENPFSNPWIITYELTDGQTHRQIWRSSQTRVLFFMIHKARLLIGVYFSYACTYVLTHIHVQYVGIHMYICTYFVYILVHTYLHAQIHACMHAFIHTYVHTYTHIHIYTLIWQLWAGIV
jgi:hypothetical protein